MNGFLCIMIVVLTIFVSFVYLRLVRTNRELSFWRSEAIRLNSNISKRDSKGRFTKKVR